MKFFLQVLLLLPMVAFPLLAQTQKSSQDVASKPHDVPFCELSQNPAAYNHELVRLTAFITYGFEDFHLSDPTCVKEGFSIWVMYGGTARSGAIYCCPGEGGEKSRPEILTIEGVRLPLANDSMFQQFTNLLVKERDTTVRATVVGTFFAGEKRTMNGTIRWEGAGHMGCCSLLVIERVESFEPHTRTDLDYTAEAGWYENEGCKPHSLNYRKHVSITFSDGRAEDSISEQRRADSGEAAWAFSDPQRVALESLKPLYPGQIPLLRRVKQAPARQVFRWKNRSNQVVVVVTRPYWLSFYASSGSVAWITTMIKEAECR